MTTRKKLGLYLHIPFCEKKCNYCGFLSFAHLGEEARATYIHTLMKEIQSYSKEFGKNYLVDSIFIGGGTPSLLSEREITQLTDCLHNNFTVDSLAEISIETNPNSLSKSKLSAYRSAGINRLSLGVQSLNDQVLSTLGRVHRSAEVYAAYDQARTLGFDNINMDLMFGIPGQTLSLWQETLNQAISLAPEHLSYYTLQIEEGTPFYRQYKNEELAFVSEAADREMYHYANDLLSQSGYDHYEISNSALPGKACRHNRKYWSMEEYLGIGMGASSYVGEKRWKNVEGWEEYLSLVESEAWPMDLDSYHSDTPKDSMAIFCFTALRTKKGIDLEAFKQRYGQEFSSAYGEKMDLLVDYKKNGDLIIDGNQIALTAKGIDRSNEIMSELV